MSKFEGYAAVTEHLYSMGPYDECLARGVFQRTLSQNPDVQLLVNHGGLPIARTGVNMTLTEDDRGLKVDADLDDDDPDVASVTRKMSAGLIDQMSFCFRVVRQTWNEDYTRRRITEVDIHRGDVSVVNQGANPATSSTVQRSSVSRAPAALAERRKLAEEIGDRVELELRSVTLDGRRVALRAAPDDTCNRCGGGGTIALKGRGVTCPQCKGTGGAENNAEVPVEAGDEVLGLDLGEYRRRIEALEYGAELRAKYTQEQIDELGKKGHAFKADDGTYDYPIEDEEDLTRAVKAVGRGNADHDAIRKYIIGRAKALGLSNLIPETWAADGSLKESEALGRDFAALRDHMRGR